MSEFKDHSTIFTVGLKITVFLYTVQELILLGKTPASWQLMKEKTVEKARSVIVKWGTTGTSVETGKFRVETSHFWHLSPATPSLSKEEGD